MTFIGGLNQFSTIKANLTITYSLLEREKDLQTMSKGNELQLICTTN